jgi:RNA polymerase sigma factor (sigma-70 family)
VKGFQQPAYAYAYALVGDHHLAQDVTQEAFVEAYRSLPALREPRAFPTWLRRIVFKHCDRFTRRRTTGLLEPGDLDEMASSLPGPAELAERREQAALVRAAVRDLPEAHRTVTTLYYMAGHSQREIAEFLEIPVKTVKSRLHTARDRLRKRMVEMVRDDFGKSSLPEGFADETVEQAVSRARAFNEGERYDEAEALLRRVLERAPEDPTALEALNRSLLRGRVLGRDRWDALTEVAGNWKTALRRVDDERIRRELALTLLAIPAMREASAFLDTWVASSGQDLERLGMLAWCRSCLDQHDAAEGFWRELLGLAARSAPEQVLDWVPFVAYTLVDSWAAAGETERARRVARGAWDIAGNLGPLRPRGDLAGDGDWLLIWREAGLDPAEIAPVLLARCGDPTEPDARAAVLGLRSHTDDPATVATAWYVLVRDLAAAGDLGPARNYRYRFALLRGLRQRGLWREANALSQETWRLLGELGAPKADRNPWNWERFNAWGAMKERDREAAMALVRLEIAERGVPEAVGWAVAVCATFGAPTPPEIVQALERGGPEAADSYGMFGWYFAAREAAAKGDAERAFKALRTSLTYWSNPPMWYPDVMARDTAWGELAKRPEFTAAFDERRQRVGPVRGQLHYFPSF